MDLANKRLLDDLFQLLVERAPYRWQREAFTQFRGGQVPSAVLAPTAAGKTMLLPIFVAALACQAIRGGQITLPRRVVFVVNRRVLVDEATGLCERLREIVSSGALPQLTDALAALSASGNGLVVSTLRGQFEDNGAWFADPTTPAIVLATPDMLGSRLLFRGYGLGKNRAPLQAGLLGVDTLVIHDEAHLAPAFGALLRMAEERSSAGAALLGRPALQVLEMTATMLPCTAPVRPVLACDPASDPELLKRMSAAKRLRIMNTESNAKRNEGIVAEVSKRTSRSLAIVVFVALPDDAAKIHAKLTAGKSPVLSEESVVVLTGTMRGHEREGLLKRTAWRRVAANRTEAGPCAVLIATGAGEIGLDLDADVLLCDEATLDRQIQRFGRCNRRGEGLGEIVVFAGAPDSSTLADRRAQATRLLRELSLSELGHDASPIALTRLREHVDYASAIEPAPPTRDLEDGILDLFAATSLRLPAVQAPEPSIWIHGLVDDERAEINLLWRHLPRHEVDAWLEAWPVLRRECARVPLYPFAKRDLPDLGDRGRVLVLDPTGQFLGEYGSAKVIADGYLVFDIGVGGLNASGLLHAESTDSVADVSASGFDGGCIATHTVCLDEEMGGWRVGCVAADSVANLVGQLHPGLMLAWHERDGDSLRLWMKAPDASAPASDESLTARPRKLSEHLDLTARAGRRIASALGLPPELAATLVRACAIHDEGKRRACWQHAIGNFDLSSPLGKSGRAAFDRVRNSGYRHEIGSLVDCEDTDLLTRHLVAAHHGHARPLVPSAARAHGGCAAAADAAALAYVQLQRDLGHWALAYLEALLKCADVMAETHADSLLQDAAIDAPPLHAKAPSTPTSAVHIPFDAANIGEYLAALGLLAWVSQTAPDTCLAWLGDGCVYSGIDERSMRSALRKLTAATVVVDEAGAQRLGRSLAKKARETGEVKVPKYPPLKLQLESLTLPVNVWCNAQFSDKSSWKLAAGNSDAQDTLRTLLNQCRAWLSEKQHLTDLRLFAVTKGVGARERGKKQDDTRRFRIDAATGWTAIDVGWSPHDEGIASVRPWIDLLATLGIQAVFAPPANRDAPYCTWQQPLPLTLARFAARGLLPDVLATYVPRFVSSGQNFDAYSSTHQQHEGDIACPQLLTI
jgi:CRISPR-associated endonuclease/helicase Cas3